MPYKVYLSPQSGELIELTPGINTLGRGNEYGIKDRRVSRKHAEIKIEESTMTATIIPLGVNPTSIKRDNTNSKLPNGEPFILLSGDEIGLLEGDITFRVLVVDDARKMETDSIADVEATQLDVDAYDSEDEGRTSANTSADGKSIKDGTSSKRKMTDSPASNAKRGRFLDNLVQIEFSELHYIKKMGTGSCGEVWLCEWKNTRVAAKKIYRSLLHGDAMKEFQSETEMLCHLRHPNVLLLMGICVTEKEMTIVTEFMSRGSLRDVLSSPDIKLDWKMLLRFAESAAAGMNYLHCYNPPIIHRDLKSHNLLVDDNFTAKVADFGLARFTKQDQKATTFCGTIQWAAPELLSGIGYTTKADVYSFGVVLWELCSRDEPYRLMDKSIITNGVTKANLRPVIPPGCPKAYAQLITDCWDADPQKRPPFADILVRLRGMQAIVAAHDKS